MGVNARLLPWAAGLAAAIAVAPLGAPQLLAFPYHARSGASEVWSETPLPQAPLDRVIGRANALVRASPLAAANEGRHIFLTRGGWRWRWLAFGFADGLALTRATNEAVLIGAASVERDAMAVSLPPSHPRTLSGIIAHETCHGMERRHFGIAIQLTAPQWLFEGYCDHVAQESSLSDAAYAALRARGETRPAMVYYEGRRRVAAALAANGGNVDALFRGTAR